MKIAVKLFVIGCSVLLMAPVFAFNHARLAVAQSAADCRGIGDWYQAIGEIQQSLDTAANDPTVSYGTLNSEPYHRAALAMGEIDAPKSVKEAHEAISLGYSTLADEIDASIAVSQGMSAGQMPTYENQSSIVIQLSDARRQLLGGFLAWTIAGVSCGITTEQFTPSEIAGCDGVADYMNTAAATIGGFWNFWNETANQTQTDTSALPLGTGELLSGAAFEDAFKLARTPAPEAAMDIQFATVTYLGSLADLYLLNLLGAMGAYYGLDQTGINQILDQHQQQLELTQQQAEDIQTGWNKLGRSCEVDTRFPAPGERDLG